ncbi:MAG TPA: hypothetical protein VK509_04280 [Polyangiales bacterium]|nr:hypothetical protein [Polyangiales bacterium]
MNRYVIRCVICCMTCCAAIGCGGDGGGGEGAWGDRAGSSSSAGRASAGSRAPSSPDAAVVDDAGRGGRAGGSSNVGGSNPGGSNAGGSGGAAGSAVTPPSPTTVAGCEDELTTQLPDDLRCTGLYADLASKQVAPSVRAFKPATELWSDGASKQRWIYLPPGTKIDNSDPDSWMFPVGTKLYKEFSSSGHRVETRIFWKEADKHWLKATYHWSADEASAMRFDGGQVDVAGKPYFIPAAKDCDRCHKGREEKTLGFEQVLLALSGAQGLTLQELTRAGLLTDPPSGSSFSIGDDGTGNAAPALRWLHVNCGVSCHNPNTAAEGYSSDLRLRLPAESIDGRSPAEFESLRTTIGVASSTPEWRNRTRITKGSARNSLLYQLASVRNIADPDNQMPPVASRVVDAEGIMLLDKWIASMR